jgi:hypothetical protein
MDCTYVRYFGSHAGKLADRLGYALSDGIGTDIPGSPAWECRRVIANVLSPAQEVDAVLLAS